MGRVRQAFEPVIVIAVDVVAEGDVPDVIRAAAYLLAGKAPELLM